MNFKVGDKVTIPQSSEPNKIYLVAQTSGSYYFEELRQRSFAVYLKHPDRNCYYGWCSHIGLKKVID